MSEAPELEELVLAYLYRMDAKLDRMIADIGHIRLQMIEMNNDLSAMRRRSPDQPE